MLDWDGDAVHRDHPQSAPVSSPPPALVPDSSPTPTPPTLLYHPPFLIAV